MKIKVTALSYFKLLFISNITKLVLGNLTYIGLSFLSKKEIIISKSQFYVILYQQKMLTNGFLAKNTRSTPYLMYIDSK